MSAIYRDLPHHTPIDWRAAKTVVIDHTGKAGSCYVQRISINDDKSVNMTFLIITALIELGVVQYFMSISDIVLKAELI